MANELDPRTRKEVFLAGMLYGDPEDLPDPETRDELYMKAIGEAIKAGGLPDPSEASEGDVLTVGADGPEWAAPAGGGKYIHNITFAGDLRFSFVNDVSTPYIVPDDVAAALKDYTSDGSFIPATGGNSSYGIIKGIRAYAPYPNDPTYIMFAIVGTKITYADGALTYSDYNSNYGTSNTIHDNVIAI